MRRRSRPAQELREAIDRLPLEIRHAALEGVKSRRIIAGEHGDGRGGVCPMAAADVRWGRIEHTTVARAQAVARAWDRYADATTSWHTASKRQLLALQSMLEASILAATPVTADPWGEHSRPVRRLGGLRAPMGTEERSRRPHTGERGRRPDTGERDRTRELRHREGWAWMRPFRSYDDYAEALRALPGIVESVERETAHGAPSLS